MSSLPHDDQRQTKNSFGKTSEGPTSNSHAVSEMLLPPTTDSIWPGMNHRWAYFVVGLNWEIMHKVYYRLILENSNNFSNSQHVYAILSNEHASIDKQNTFQFLSYAVWRSVPFWRQQLIIQVNVNHSSKPIWCCSSCFWLSPILWHANMDLKWTCLYMSLHAFSLFH